MRQKLFISLGLVFATVAVYWQLGQCDFVNFDDPAYTENPQITRGLTASGIAWAFKAIVVSNWLPVTLVSHMLDCQLFGVNPRAHHLVNLLFHVLNTLLLFHLLRKLTRELWPSAIVAALFALHPLHVESVAWIAERKDVLSTLFGLLTLWAYARYVSENARSQVPGVRNRASRIAYLASLLFFALGLMSKPMLVTWPFVLLLLDFWPLKRWTMDDERWTIFHLVREKIPFFALTIASSVVTFLIQRHTGAVMPGELMTSLERIFNALTAYSGYLGKTFWPTQLSVFYPLQDAWTASQVAGAALLLMAVTAFVVWQIRRRPFLAVGWFWFLGTMVPVIGLVQVGSQSMADRYTYIPLIGFFVAVVWGAKDLLQRAPQIFRALIAGAVIVACAVVTFFQVQHWKNSEALFRHALAVTTSNATAHYNLGHALLQTGRAEEALGHFEQALVLDPDFAPVHGEIAHLREMEGRFREAFDGYQKSLRLKPDMPEALNNFAWLLATCPDDSIRNGAEAVRRAERACELTYHQKTIYVSTLAAAYAEAGRFDDAVRTVEKAIALATENGETNLAEINGQFVEVYRARRTVREAMSQ